MPPPTLTLLPCPDDEPTDAVGVATGVRATGAADVDGIVDDYLADLSAPTAAAYARDIVHLRDHLDSVGVDFVGAGRADLSRWVRAQEAAGVPATTIRRRLSAVTGLYSYVVSIGILPISPAQGLRRPRGSPAVRLGLDADELARLLAAARSDGTTAELLVLLLLVHGLRISEACGISDGDLISHNGHRAVIVARKGGRLQIIGLIDEVADLVELLVAAQGPGPVLRGREGCRLARQVAWRWVRRIGAAAGLDETVFPHLLRHSHVTQALAGGTPMPVVQAGVGHSDIRTTLAYAKAISALAAEPGRCVWERVAGS